MADDTSRPERPSDGGDPARGRAGDDLGVGRHMASVQQFAAGPGGDDQEGAGRSLGGLGGDDRGGLASGGGLDPANVQGGSEGGRDGGGLDAADRGGGGLGFGQAAGAAQQDQGFGRVDHDHPNRSFDDPMDVRTGAGPTNEQRDQLTAQAAAQSRTDASDAQDLQDKTRAQADLGSANNNTSL